MSQTLRNFAAFEVSLRNMSNGANVIITKSQAKSQVNHGLYNKIESFPATAMFINLCLLAEYVKIVSKVREKWLFLRENAGKL